MPYTVAVVPCHIFSMNDYVLQLQNARNEVDVCSTFHPYLEGMLPRKRTRSGCSKYVHARIKLMEYVASQLIRLGPTTEYYAYDCMNCLILWSLVDMPRCRQGHSFFFRYSIHPCMHICLRSHTVNNIKPLK